MPPLGGAMRWDTMLEGACMAPGNRYTHTIFTDIDFICSEWGARNLFFPMRVSFSETNWEALTELEFGALMF